MDWTVRAEVGWRSPATCVRKRLPFLTVAPRAHETATAGPFPIRCINVDRSQYPDFSAHCWVRGADAAAVSAFLTPARISFFETAKLPGVLATNANYLVYFEDGTLRTEPDFDSFIATVEKLIAAIL